MQDGRCLVLALTRGKHQFRSTNAQSRIDIDLKVGQSYYIRVDIAAGFPKGYGRLTLMLPEQGESEIRQVKPVDRDMVRIGHYCLPTS